MKIENVKSLIETLKEYRDDSEVLVMDYKKMLDTFDLDEGMSFPENHGGILVYQDDELQLAALVPEVEVTDIEEEEEDDED